MKRMILLLLLLAVMASLLAYTALSLRPQAGPQRLRAPQHLHLFNWGEGSHSN